MILVYVDGTFNGCRPCSEAPGAARRVRESLVGAEGWREHEADHRHAPEPGAIAISSLQLIFYPIHYTSISFYFYIYILYLI